MSNYNGVLHAMLFSCFFLNNVFFLLRLLMYPEYNVISLFLTEKVIDFYDPGACWYGGGWGGGG